MFKIIISKMSTIIHPINKIKIQLLLNKIKQQVDFSIIKILYTINKIILLGSLKINNQIKQFLIFLVINQII